MGWGGEPQTRAPDENVRFGTTVERVSGGYVVNGTKAFSTSAGAAQWALLFVNTAGVGGVRHATASPETQLTLACDTSDASITIDGSWWDPIGMRATVSYLVHFDRTFIPEENVLGYPGQYLTEEWQTRFITHFAASFLGAAEAAYEFAHEYVTTQNKGGDPYVQHHIATMLISVETGHLWLRHVARLWETGQDDEAKVASSRARHIIEHLAEDTVKRAIRACGARSLNRPAPLERLYRDLSFYVRHENDDHSLAMIGKAILGLPYDASFYRT